MKRQLPLGGLALAAASRVAAAAARGKPARQPGLEVLTTHLANPEPVTPVPGQRLRPRRDLDRSFDPAAVAVETAAVQHLGYVPPVQAGVLSRLLDHGASGYAVLTPQGGLRVFLET
nr:HIRAN domain-containing protein [Paracoccus saliphilus]